MEEKKEQPSQDTGNIFDEFEAGNSIESPSEKQQKNLLSYAQIGGSILKMLNACLLLVIFVMLMYVSLQKSQYFTNLSFLKPICFVFLGDVVPPDGSCAGVTTVLNSYKTTLKETKATQFSKISSIIAELYAYQNFIFSKEVTFLLERSKNRVKPLDIITEFDTLKNTFEPIEKARIKCYDLTMNINNIVEITCDAYSSDWEKRIVGFSGDKVNTDVEGTSVSIANSFINFIEKSQSNFTLIDRQKVFNVTRVNDGGVYTKKTNFKIKLIYQNNNL